MWSNVAFVYWIPGRRRIGVFRLLFVSTRTKGRSAFDGFPTALHFELDEKCIYCINTHCTAHSRLYDAPKLLKVATANTRPRNHHTEPSTDSIYRYFDRESRSSTNPIYPIDLRRFLRSSLSCSMNKHHENQFQARHQPANNDIKENQSSLDSSLLYAKVQRFEMLKGSLGRRSFQTHSKAFLVQHHLLNGSNITNQPRHHLIIPITPASLAQW